MVKAKLALFGWRLPSLVAANANGTSGGGSDDVDRQWLQSSIAVVLSGRGSGLIWVHCGERPCEHRSEGLQGLPSSCTSEHSRGVHVWEPMEVLKRLYSGEYSRRAQV